jgi:hypothetical protein
MNDILWQIVGGLGGIIAGVVLLLAYYKAKGWW